MISPVIVILKILIVMLNSGTKSRKIEKKLTKAKLSDLETSEDTDIFPKQTLHISLAQPCTTSTMLLRGRSELKQGEDDLVGCVQR